MSRNKLCSKVHVCFMAVSSQYLSLGGLRSQITHRGPSDWQPSQDPAHLGLSLTTQESVMYPRYIVNVSAYVALTPAASEVVSSRSVTVLPLIQMIGSTKIAPMMTYPWR